MVKKWILSLFIAVLVSVITACGSGDESAEDNNKELVKQEEETAEDSEVALGGGEDVEQPEMPEPDLEGIPDVVAIVNGEEITKEEFESIYLGQFQQVAIQSMMLGQEVDQVQLKQQIVDSMVGQELLIQEAEKGGFEASQEDINEILDILVEQNGLESKDEFIAALEEQGMVEAEVMSLLEMQIKVDRLIASELGDIEPTNEELEKAYKMITTQQEQIGGEAEIPSFDEMKPELEEQVKSQKEIEATQSLVKELREGAEITIYL